MFDLFSDFDKLGEKQESILTGTKQQLKCEACNNEFEVEEGTLHDTLCETCRGNNFNEVSEEPKLMISSDLDTVDKL